VEISLNTKTRLRDQALGPLAPLASFSLLRQSRTQSNACARARKALALGKLTTGTPKFRGSGSGTIDKR
jgi:hypothetical protein